MVNLSVGNTLGEDIQSGELDDNAVIASKLATGWKLVSTAAFTTESNISLTSLTSRKKFKLRIVALGSQASSIFMKLNNDGGANYDVIDISAAVITQNQNQTSCKIGAYTNATFPTVIEITFSGTTNNPAIAIKNSSGDGTNVGMMQGASYDGAADITRIDFYPGAGTITGQYALYYEYELENAT